MTDITANSDALALSNNVELADDVKDRRLAVYYLTEQKKSYGKDRIVYGEVGEEVLVLSKSCRPIMGGAGVTARLPYPQVKAIRNEAES